MFGILLPRSGASHQITGWAVSAPRCQVPGARCQVPGARCLCQVPEHWKVSFFVGAGRLGTLRWGISSEVKEIQETEIYRHYVWCYRRNWKVWKWIPLAFGPSPGQLLTRQSCWEAADDWSIGTLRARTLARGRCQETCCTSAAASSSSSSSADVRRLPRLGFNSHLHHLVLRTSPGDTAPFLMASLFSEWQQKESLWKLEKNAKSKSAYSTKRKRTSSCHTKKNRFDSVSLYRTADFGRRNKDFVWSTLISIYKPLTF